MKYRAHVVAAVVVLTAVFSLSVRSESEAVPPQEQEPVLVAFMPFELEGSATAEVARSMSERLKEPLDADPRIELAPADVGPQYLIKGVVYAGEGNRAFISLLLLDGKSQGILWCENYDYRGINADMIAPDIINAVLK